MGNYIIRDGELYHYGVPGMKWGVRKSRTTLGPSFGNRYHSKAANRIQKDADDLRKHGYKAEADAVEKVAAKARQKASESQKKVNAKRERKAKLNKAYSDFQKDLYILEKSGRGNDIDAVIKRSAQYDAEVRSIKDTYKAEVGRKYIKERFGV